MTLIQELVKKGVINIATISDVVLAKALKDKANKDFATARSAAKSASDKQIANAARKAAIATASAIRDAALSQLPDLGPEPTKPAKK